MNVILYLLPIALGLGLIGLGGFLWSLKKGQYDDLEGAAVRILDDDDLPESQRPRRSPPARRQGTERDRG